MQGTLTQAGTTSPATDDRIAAARASGRFFWLDLDTTDPADAQTTSLLLDTLGFHRLAVSDAAGFGRRPKLEEFDGFVYMVVHGADARGGTTQEVHLFFNAASVVTVHRGASTAMDEVRRRVDQHPAADTAAPHIVLVYLIVDNLTDSFFPVLSDFDDKVDALEDQILDRPTEDQLGTIFEMKRTIIAMRKVITPQRDMFAEVTAGVTDIPGMTDEAGRYFRDLYDHLIRLSDMVDGYRDLLSGVMDTHISTVSNRLNVVMKQLAIIATVFLPLSFLTGFFGQNFAWLVANLRSGWTFLWLGLGTEVVALGILLILFRRRGWLGGPSE